MGFAEKIEKMAHDKEKERGCKDIEKLFNYLENSEVEDIDDILAKIKNSNSSGLYRKLIEAYQTENTVPRDRVFTLDELLQVRILRLSRDNLRFGGLLTTVFTPSLITAKQFLSIYSFIEYTYSIFAQRPTNWDDALNIYFSRLDERIIFAMDRFDEIELGNMPKPTPEYFQMLRRVKWKNKISKKLYDKLTELMFEIKKFVLDYPDLTQQAGWITTYRVTEDLFIQTIAGCSAVNEGRLEIGVEDVVRAYKTFFKLIKTDVTKYKAIPELLEGIDGYHGNLKHDSYLVCESCGGYYKLQPGESPDDFSDTCECGGELVYKTNLEE